MRSEWKDIPGEATASKETGGLVASAVLEEMEVWLRWRVYEGERTLPPPNLDQGALTLTNTHPQIPPVHYEGGVVYLEDKKSR